MATCAEIQKQALNCASWANLKEDPNAQAQIGTHKNIALAHE